MTSWQRRTRIGLAIFGVLFTGFVYFSIGERQKARAPVQVQRQDPKAVAETEHGELLRIRQTEQDFTVKFARQLAYEDGSQKLFEVVITAKKSDGRTYVVTADEAQAGKDQLEKQLTGHVKLTVSDGFELTTDRATHSGSDGIVHAPGAIEFKKGQMTGSGVNATYDQNKDVLTIAENAKIDMSDDAGKPTTNFAAGSATLDRTQNVLNLDVKAHVLRNQQVIDADHVTTRLSDDEQIVQFIELRNNARVSGGSSIDSMSARDIDMDYTDDGRALERVALVGGAGIAMTGSGGGPGRQIIGESIEVHLAPDGSIVGVTAREKVRLDLPASGDSPAGSIKAGALDGTGEPGRGLTQTEFRDNVEYREAGKRGAADRVVRSQSLKAALANDSVSDASFKGSVTFEEEGLGARAADIRYQPQKNALTLNGSDAGGGPHVSVDQISIDAKSIDVGIEDRRINAAEVKTTLSPAKPKQAGREASTGVSIPGLLRQNEIAHINADTLEYRGKAGQAIYRGSAALWQGDTTIRGDIISLDQDKGNLVATGSARSTLELDTGQSVGRANEIRYDDSKRVVTYSTAALAPTSDGGSTPVAARGSTPADVRRAVPARDAQLGGSQGDLRAERIEIVLATQGNTVERLEAYTSVTLKVDKRTVVGSRLTYYASDERYVMSGTGTSPVTISDARPASTGAASCRETTGRTLTFFKSTDRIIVDGNEEKLTETQVKPCATPSSSR